MLSCTAHEAACRVTIIYLNIPLTFLAAAGKSASYWCCLWLQYMHMVLLGIDLLRMRNNSDMYKADQQEKGFHIILTGLDTAAKAAESDKLQYPDLHNMCDDNLQHLAAMVATLLLAQQMCFETESAAPTIRHKIDRVRLPDVQYAVQCPFVMQCPHDVPLILIHMQVSLTTLDNIRLRSRSSPLGRRVARQPRSAAELL